VGLRIFVDFDGTISRVDVGDHLFQELGGETCTRLVQDYLAGKINARECFIGECTAAGAVRPEVIDEILDRQEIDPTFTNFVDFCSRRQIDFTILSDGFDYYIERILKRHGFENLTFFANHLEFQAADGTGRVSLVPVFPYRDAECDRCANCKRNHVLTLSSEEDIIVYIGDGYSDRCPSRYADIVFAKRALIRYCRQENISYYEFHHLQDVVGRLEKILSRKRIRKRWQAELRRREAFLQG